MVRSEVLSRVKAKRDWTKQDIEELCYMMDSRCYVAYSESVICLTNDRGKKVSTGCHYYCQYEKNGTYGTVHAMTWNKLAEKLVETLVGRGISFYNLNVVSMNSWLILSGILDLHCDIQIVQSENGYRKEYALYRDRIDGDWCRRSDIRSANLMDIVGYVKRKYDVETYPKYYDERSFCK